MAVSITVDEKMLSLILFLAIMICTSLACLVTSDVEFVEIGLSSYLIEAIMDLDVSGYPESGQKLLEALRLKETGYNIKYGEQVGFAFLISLSVWVFVRYYLLFKIQKRAWTNGIVVKHATSVITKLLIPIITDPRYSARFAKVLPNGHRAYQGSDYYSIAKFIITEKPIFLASFPPLFSPPRQLDAFVNSIRALQHLRNDNSHQDRNNFISIENVNSAFMHAEEIRALMIERNVLERKIFIPRTFAELKELFHMMRKGKMMDSVCRKLGWHRGRYETAKLKLAELKKQWEKELILIRKRD